MRSLDTPRCGHGRGGLSFEDETRREQLEHLMESAVVFVLLFLGIGLVWTLMKRWEGERLQRRLREDRERGGRTSD
jgi:hypothetical protein